MAGTLGQWYVELVSKGGQRVLAEVNMIRAGMTKADREHEQQTRQQKRRVTETRQQWFQLGNTVRASNLVMAGAICGFARAGLAGTTQGAALSVRFQQLSREISALFLPQIDGATRQADGSQVSEPLPVAGQSSGAEVLHRDQVLQGTR